MTGLLTIVFSVAFAILINADGLIQIVVSSYKETGAYNFIVGSLIFCLCGVAILIYKFMARDVRALTFWEVILMGVLVLLVSIQLISSAIDAHPLKLIRDIFYFGSFILFGLMFRVIMRGYPLLGSRFIFWLILLNVVLFPGIGLLINNFDAEGRFTGMQMAASMYGNTAALMFIAIFENNMRKGASIILALIAVAAVVASGTRVALMIIIFYMSYVLIRRISRHGYQRQILALIFSFSAASIALFLFYHVAELIRQSDLRILLLSDIEAGSIQTRLEWYGEIAQALSKDSFVGGHGSGASELLTGHITHFDLLRFWYDYSLIFLLLFFLMLFVYCKVFGRDVLLPFLFASGQFILLSLHNLFQAPSLLFLFSLIVALIARNHNSVALSSVTPNKWLKFSQTAQLYR